jgi:hypothetical protein
MELEERSEKQNRKLILAVLALLDKRFRQLAGQVAYSLFRNNNLSVDQQIIRLDALLNEFGVKINISISNAMIRSWNLANQKNDKLVTEYCDNIQVDKMDTFFQANTQVLKAFINRTENGMNLSQRVWKLTEPFKSQLEIYLKSGIGSGRSADSIAQDIQQLLKEPNKLFRRVRTPEGRLILSKAAKAYHPGRGIYRSSYQNAVRLASNEINMAYRMSDYTRRQQLPFLRGIRINLSGSHPRPDICDHMTGDYPKEFVFRGWHPRCFCYTTSIMLSGIEFKRLQETGTEPKRMVRDIPQVAKTFLDKNREVLTKIKQKPYFLTDNRLRTF